MRENYVLRPNVKRNYNLKRWYGITVEEYDELLHRQGGVCAICRDTDKDSTRVQKMSVDHDHDTGKVRGILCQKCNHLLGCGRDNVDILQDAIAYLRRHYQ